MKKRKKQDNQQKYLIIAVIVIGVVILYMLFMSVEEPRFSRTPTAIKTPQGDALPRDLGEGSDVCSETDGYSYEGIPNYWLRGNTTKGTYTATDYCLSYSVLREYYCDENNNIQFIDFWCFYNLRGYCGEGRCWR